jgi:hypothetical protein
MISPAKAPAEHSGANREVFQQHIGEKSPRHEQGARAAGSSAQLHA